MSISTVHQTESILYNFLKLQGPKGNLHEKLVINVCVSPSSLAVKGRQSMSTETSFDHGKAGQPSLPGIEDQVAIPLLHLQLIYDPFSSTHVLNLLLHAF